MESERATRKRGVRAAALPGLHGALPSSAPLPPHAGHRGPPCPPKSRHEGILGSGQSGGR